MRRGWTFRGDAPYLSPHLRHLVGAARCAFRQDWRLARALGWANHRALSPSSSRLYGRGKARCGSEAGVMSDKRPTNQRQFMSRSVGERRDWPGSSSKYSAAPAFGRQGPEVRILSPRPRFPPFFWHRHPLPSDEWPTNSVCSPPFSGWPDDTGGGPRTRLLPKFTCSISAAA